MSSLTGAEAELHFPREIPSDAELDATLSGLEQQIAKLSETLADREDDLTFHFNENKRLERVVEELEDEVYSLGHTIADLRDDIDALESEKDDLQETIDELELELREARSFICRGEC